MMVMSDGGGRWLVFNQKATEQGPPLTENLRETNVEL